MKKHIIGLALFSFIVSVAAVGYRIFYVTEYLSLSCWTVKSIQKESSDTVIIKQAVYNLNSEVFNFEPDANSNSPIELHFFAKDGNNTRYVGSFYSLQSVTTNKVRSCFKCLENIKLYENLYVQAEHTSWDRHINDPRYSNFDMKKATPILLNYDK